MKYCSRCRTNMDDVEFWRGQSKCKRCSQAAHREWVRNNKDRANRIRIKSVYGLTDEEYDNLPDHCVICGSQENLCIDHSHVSGRVRGRLCHHHNLGLGFFKDDPTLLMRAAEYLLGSMEALDPR